MSWDLLSIDLDGTLVDSADEIAEAANRTLHEHGIAQRPPEEIALLIGAGTRELMCKLLARCLHDDSRLADRVRVDDVLASFDAHYVMTTGSSARPYPGCEQMLADLRHDGVRLACTTNKELRHASRLLEATGLLGSFDLLIGGDSLPEKKPHRSVLHHVARELGVATSRCAHLGDSAIDVAAARNAGFAAWAVGYGYNSGVPIADSRPDRLFDGLPQVTRHLLDGRRRAA